MPKLPRTAKAIIKQKLRTGEWSFGTVLRALSDIVYEIYERGDGLDYAVRELLNDVARQLEDIDIATRRIL